MEQIGLPLNFRTAGHFRRRTQDMTELELLKSLDRNVLQPTSREWASESNSDIIHTVIECLKIALGECNYEGHVIGKLEFAINFGSKTALELASLVVRVLVEKNREVRDLII